jgi:sensor histidine kinase YesM
LPPGGAIRYIGPTLSSYAYLLEGLTIRRVLAVTAVCAVASAAVVWLFSNTYPDLLVSALCVGYTSMLLFTIEGNIRQAAFPQEAMQVAAVVLGSCVGTILAGLVKQRTLAQMLSERLAGVLITMGLGIGVGCVVVATLILREKHSRDQARFHRGESERHQLEKNLLEAKLQLMQAQVEPHFLFNTLANVQHLVETDPSEASRMLESLIQYLRAALPQMRESSTRLGREIEMARAFLDIHRIRMGARLGYAIEVPESLRELTFPPMMLITLVENAVKHGIDPCCEIGKITIRAEEAGGRLRVSVEDTGEGIRPKKGGGVGLANIRERLKALYGTSARLVVEEREPHGVVASIEVPAATTA